MSRRVTIRGGQPISHASDVPTFNETLKRDALGVCDQVRQAANAWAVAITTWVIYLKAAGRTPSTIRLRRYYVDRFARYAVALDLVPVVVRLSHLTEFMAYEGWGSEARKSARAGLCGFYQFLVDDGQLSEADNPTRKLPRVGVDHALPRPAPDAAFQQALWLADDKQELMLMLAGYAGLRREEIAQVHLRDFDWDSGELLVHGKGRKERRVPIHPDLGRAVRKVIERRRVGQVGTGFRLYVAGIGPDSYLFPGKHGHVSPDNVGRTLQRLLPGMWTGHTLRHRFATKAYAAERDIRAVQELLGHSKPETTARYTQVPTEAKAAAVRAVGLDAA
jgi:integrase/recombinase XerC